MGNRSWHSIIWSAVTVVSLLSLMTPFIIFTFSFLMIPVLMLYVKSSTKRFVISYVLSLLVVYLLTQWHGISLISVSLFMLPPVLVMGNLYKRKAPARSVLTAGIVTILAEALLSLLIGYMLGFDPVAKFKGFMIDSIASMPPGIREVLPKDQDWYVNFIVQVIPLYLIFVALFFTFVTHGISRWLLNKTGEGIPGLRPMREWMLQKSLVWIYLVVFVLDMFMNPASTALIPTLLMNAMPLLMLAFAIQAIGFLFFIAHTNRWKPVLPILAIILVCFMPPLFIVYSLLGVFDVAFPIRERFKKNL
ncbi:DUF2232 domain-containing protein [Paenibacillus sp. GCM10023248]|uniref:DUF2232 domain-containing protein n=1 Tax=Bacillales TaxID=1385 RepID=UPI002379AA4B|nr:MULTISPECIES: DUF2232 domain-containing protein [Bacillales]MDD9270826.1 DUF2232 domain-containing protein [Paenibacillus sp. MAHUQ-63]MDR6883263.1 uncharacterized protein YybS (DUF2232 family) [Bacillus sp. 3255]